MKQGDKKISILIVEDFPEDVELMLRAIRKHGYVVNFLNVITLEDFRRGLAERTWDVIISDFRLPRFNGIDVLNVYKEFNLNTPFLLVSGAIGEETAIMAMKSGVHDYIMKGNLARLVPAIEREIREAGSRARRELAERELHRWEKVFEYAGWGVALLSSDGRILQANPAFARMHVCPLKELIGMPLETLFANTIMNEAFMREYAAALAGERCVIESSHHTRNGRIFPVLMDVAPVKDEKGQVEFLAANFQDLTPQREVDMAMRRANQALLEVNQVRSEFISIVSHELRTPLTAIREGILLVHDGIEGPLSPGQQETLEIACRNVDRLARLIQNILQFEKIESGRLVIHHARHDLKPIFQELYDLMSPVCRKKGITFVYEAPEQPVWAVCDSDSMRQIGINLLDNAIKFSRQGDKITLSLWQEDGRIFFSVADTGPGIKKGDQEKIFGMFMQSFTDGIKTGGTGVGLAVCKKLIMLHDGDIRVESVAGKGARFIVELPAVPVTKRAGREPALV